MKQLGEWIRRQWRQNVIGISPAPEYTTWKSLADFMQWGIKDDDQKSRKLGRQVREFEDETTLMFETFKKLIGTLTPAGIVFAVVGGRLMSEQSFAASMFIVMACVSIIFVIWGLSTRYKVMKKAHDSSPSALMVVDGIGRQGSPLAEELAADVWYYYQWKWHRYNTRLAIDRIFFMACVLLAATMGCVGMSVLF